jgi:hypothetical protein
MTFEKFVQITKHNNTPEELAREFYDFTNEMLKKHDLSWKELFINLMAISTNENQVNFVKGFFGEDIVRLIELLEKLKPYKNN